MDFLWFLLVIWHHNHVKLDCFHLYGYFCCYRCNTILNISPRGVIFTYQDVNQSSDRSFREPLRIPTVLCDPSAWPRGLCEPASMRPCTVVGPRARSRSIARPCLLRARLCRCLCRASWRTKWEISLVWPVWHDILTMPSARDYMI